jgi:hypothetical protein
MDLPVPCSFHLIPSMLMGGGLSRGWPRRAKINWLQNTAKLFGPDRQDAPEYRCG